MEGCLICRDLEHCRLCDMGYYLVNGSCNSCGVALEGCRSCESETKCLACQGNYTVSRDFRCKELRAESAFEEVSLVTRYVSASVLSHTLRIKGSQFSAVDLDLSQYTTIVLLKAGGDEIELIIQSYEWGRNMKSIIFYTNNPFDFESENSGIQRMKLIDGRRLWLGEGRLLANSNFKVDANISLNMDADTAKTIMPESNNGGSLKVGYNINQP